VFLAPGAFHLTLHTSFCREESGIGILGLSRNRWFLDLGGNLGLRPQRPHEAKFRTFSTFKTSALWPDVLLRSTVPRISRFFCRA